MFLKGYTDFTYYIINIDRYRARVSSIIFASYSSFNIDSYTSILCVNREKTSLILSRDVLVYEEER